MFVRQQIGPQAGQIIEMPYLAAQNCLSCGSAVAVTDEEIAEAGLVPADLPPAVKPDEMPPGYRVEESTFEGEDGEEEAVQRGGYDVLDPAGVILTRDVFVPNLIEARRIAQDHYAADLEAAKQPEPDQAAAGDDAPVIEWDENWRDAHWATQVKLAKQFDSSVEKKAEAVDVLEKEEARRKEEADAAGDDASGQDT